MKHVVKHGSPGRSILESRDFFFFSVAAQEKGPPDISTSQTGKTALRPRLFERFFERDFVFFFCFFASFFERDSNRPFHVGSTDRLCLESESTHNSGVSLRRAPLHIIISDYSGDPLRPDRFSDE